MQRLRRCGSILLVLMALALPQAAWCAVKVKDLARLDGARDTAVLGYGLVVGLSGTGDSRNNLATLQSVANMLQEFGLQVPSSSLNTRNVAAVLVTALLPSTVRPGDRIDINVAAIGDSRSLLGGTLLYTPLLGADRRTYAVAQGALSVAGFRIEQNGNVIQKNHPTAGTIPEGAIAERELAPQLPADADTLDLILHDPDYTTAQRMADAINAAVPRASAAAIDAGRVRLQTQHATGPALVSLAAAVEEITVEPDARARVVVNERTGTIVAGGDIWISAVTVTQGDIRVAIRQYYEVSQPSNVFVERSDGIRTAVVPQTRVRVNEDAVQSVELKEGATIDDLVRSLKAIRASTQDVIAVLQGIKRAGALHAELIVQ